MKIRPQVFLGKYLMLVFLLECFYNQTVWTAAARYKQAKCNTNLKFYYHRSMKEKRSNNSLNIWQGCRYFCYRFGQRFSGSLNRQARYSLRLRVCWHINTFPTLTYHLQTIKFKKTLLQILCGRLNGLTIFTLKTIFSAVLSSTNKIVL